MPLVYIHSSVSTPAEAVKRELLAELSQTAAKAFGKPEDYVMTCLDTGLSMTFGGTHDAACFIEVKNIGTMTPDQTRRLSEQLCGAVERLLGVPPDRTYIEFQNAVGHLWGWNRTTFG